MEKKRHALALERFEVVQDYPFRENNFEMNQIVCAFPSPANQFDIHFYQAYPKIFRPVAWYEFRYFEQLPTYVRKIHNGGYHLEGDFLIVSEWKFLDNKSYLNNLGEKPPGLMGRGSRWEAVIAGRQYNAAYFEPITEEEYDQAPEKHRPTTGC